MTFDYGWMTAMVGMFGLFLVAIWLEARRSLRALVDDEMTNAEAEIEEDYRAVMARLEARSRLTHMRMTQLQMAQARAAQTRSAQLRANRLEDARLETVRLEMAQAARTAQAARAAQAHQPATQRRREPVREQPQQQPREQLGEQPARRRQRRVRSDAPALQGQIAFRALAPHANTTTSLVNGPLAGNALGQNEVARSGYRAA